MEQETSPEKKKITVPVGFSLPRSVLRIVDALAVKQYRTRANMCRLLIKEALQKRGLWPSNKDKGQD
tara:strand:+ start:88 stop:288 length:201 start_codon:yes stop_codon:yes gene_type:complete